MKITLWAAMSMATLSLPHAFAQAPCRGAALTGTVRDTTQAFIPGATVTAENGQTATSGSDGRYSFTCIENGEHRLEAAAPGFSAQQMQVTMPHRGPVDLELRPEVQTEINVSGGEAPAMESASASGPTQMISESRLQSLADDPDDLLRELQQLAAASGGNPANTTIAVDGFQGTSNLPPKSSIAYIQVNPDQFSAQYREPPFDGARVEIYTRPGQKTYHGALFATNGSPWENARDPFSTSKASIGKQRYGFELTGPVRKTGSDFSLTLEHRSIDNFAVVNAVTLDPSGNTTSTIANVATPQRLWLGTARLDWQLSAKNTFTASYSANVNDRGNRGVGGTALAETGYDSLGYEHMLRFSNVTTASPRFMHETRVSLRWDGENDTPLSNTPQLQVQGAFTSGGASIGPQQIHELNTEIDDDAILTTKRHTVKFGTYLMMYNEHQRLTTNFNGMYTFGGGTAPVLGPDNQPIPGQTATISGFEQYRRAVLGLPGGAATAYSNVAGDPKISFLQVRDALFIQDDWNVGRGLHIASGVRYFLQNNPTVLNSLTPRLGVMWSPTKKGTWTLHAHFGLFSGQYGQGDPAEVMREDGVHRITSTVYNPVYGDPFAGATPIHSMRVFSPHISNLTWAATNVGGTYALWHGWNLSTDLFWGRIWNYTRSMNLNAPQNGQPTGPRPITPNLDILQVQNSGQGRVNAVFAGIEQHSLKYVQIFVGGVRVNLIDDTDDNTFFTTQNPSSNAGEFAHRTNQGLWHIFGNATVHLPMKADLSADFHANSGGYYNITTGFDNNGDGSFNDRPQYATPGTPGAIATPYGLLVASGGSSVFPRNKGVMPWTVYLDMNVQRAFSLTRNAQAEHPQKLTLNVRSSNILNHLNVSSVGGVLGSPLFGVPYAADNGRRIEAGVRYSF